MNQLHLEVIYGGDHNLACFYMAEAVKVVASNFEEELKWDVVYVFKKEGAKRFYDLSVAEYGEENVKKHLCLAPVPSIFIDQKLIFDQIPPVEELEDTIKQMIKKKAG